MKKFFVLIKKEVRELLTPQMLIPLLAIMLVFVFIGRIVGKQTQQTAGPQTVSVINLDKSPAADVLIALMRQNKLDPLVHDSGEARQWTIADKTKSAVVIPEGYGGQVQAGKAATVEVYTVLANFSAFGNRTSQQVASALSAVSGQLSAQYAARFPGVDAGVIKSPLVAQNTIIVGSRQAQANPAAVLGLVSGQTTFIPIILFLIITLSSQLIAVSMATEKENKTLETLLSAPVSRRAIVAAKLIGAGLVALLTAVIYMLGMSFYVKGLTGTASGGQTDAATQAAVRALGLTFSVQDYLLLGLMLFLAILVALAIAMILGSFVEDVKSVQGAVAPLMVLALIPYFLTLMVDLSALSPAVRLLVYAIPFSHAFLAAPNLMLHHYGQLLWGMLYLFALFMVFVLFAGRLFSSEKILTMKLSFKKRR